MNDQEFFEDGTDRTPHNKAGLNEAFRALRKRGLLAKQNYLCCSGCANAAIVDEAAKLKKPVSGAVFYHKQSGDHLREGRSFYLQFGALPSGTPAEEKAVGRMVVEELKRAGIRVEWNGEVSKAILVQPGEPDAPTIWERLG